MMKTYHMAVIPVKDAMYPKIQVKPIKVDSWKDKQVSSNSVAISFVFQVVLLEMLSLICPLVFCSATRSVL